MKVLFYKQFTGKLYITPVLENGIPVYTKESEQHISKSTKLFFEEEGIKVSRVYVLASGQLHSDGEVVVWDIMVDGKSLFKKDYLLYCRLVGIYKRNHNRKISMRDFYQDVEHHEIVHLWELTHGVVSVPVPFDMEGDTVYLDKKHTKHVSYNGQVKPLGYEYYKLGSK